MPVKVLTKMKYKDVRVCGWVHFTSGHKHYRSKTYALALALTTRQA